MVCNEYAISNGSLDLEPVANLFVAYDSYGTGGNFKQYDRPPSKEHHRTSLSIAMQLNIRETSSSDLDDILFVEHTAFGHDEEAGLVRDLLEDPSAKPMLSLLAFKDDRAVGHILFTAAHLTGADNKVAILAPLAVVPEAQRQGIGGQLIKRGLELLSECLSLLQDSRSLSMSEKPTSPCNNPMKVLSFDSAKFPNPSFR